MGKEFKIYFITLFIIVLSTLLDAQNRELVWADEFNENSIDVSVWDYDIGPSNDNVHYYTSRTENVKIVDNVLNIIALEEPYMGFDYTSGLIKTKISWHYGRIEARIKLPPTKGFVPAFWMLPADNIYGWWPKSGEIDIMEHPTNEVSNIYGSIHTETYNNFGGIGNVGDVIVVADAETEFHIYAVEWSEDKIEFFVDDNLYYTFTNVHNGSAAWPFNQPFYIILNLAVGGGWVGNPDETTIFPAIMQVDWVRVYQYLDDMTIDGPDYVSYNSSNISYSIPAISDAEYSWEVPGNATISSNQNLNHMSVDWGIFGGEIKADISTKDDNFIFSKPVKVSSNLLKNPGFEKGVKYWISKVGFPAAADFNLNNSEVSYGDQALSIDVQTLASNPWDIQLSQGELVLNAGLQYKLSFWAKSDNVNCEINLALINDDFFVYHSERIELSDEWTQYKIDYTATANDVISLNIDLGIQTGMYYFDRFLFTTPDLLAVNQINNGDFFNKDENWNFTVLGAAQAQDTVINGEYSVTISNAGNEIWDIHFGQPRINIENGKEYIISFDAYASAPRTISVLVGKNGNPWTVYHQSKIFSLSTEKQTYHYSFIMNYPSDDQARFGFDIGGFADDVFFDNILVNSGTIPVSSITDISIKPEIIQLYQNYPNPFNPKTTISYFLPKTSNVELSIFNLLGQKIKVLTAKKQTAGIHRLEFESGNLTSGVYLYRLQVNNNIMKTKKLIILK